MTLTKEQLKDVRAGLLEIDRCGDLVLTTKGRQAVCEHRHWEIRHYTMMGKPKVTRCVSCGKLHQVEVDNE